ncbi:MAG: hypothetical protein LBL70_05040, partial [Treponema sp.]|nr:hypothetical protein [Treponema sp.]
MKKKIAVLFGLLAALVWGCDLFLGPDEPAGDSGGTGGNLVIRVGSAGDESRAVTSGADLPSGVLNSLRYELTLTGPGGEVLKQTVMGAETLNLTVGLGEWRIAARAYKEDGLAGTGSLSITVVPGLNSVRVPMNINGGYFDITVDASMVNGTVAADWDAAFPETTVTLTVMPNPGYILKAGTLTYHYGSLDYEPEGSGLIYSFTMPAADVAVRAEFEALPPDVYSIMAASISHGTVNPSVTSAPAGTPVTLTVTADSGYVLQPGSVKYNDGTTDHPLAGPPYSFTMPLGDVTVSAQFSQYVRYVRAVGAGSEDGTSWDDAS